MKKTLLLIIAVILGVSAQAFDFEQDGIAYNITSQTDKTVEVTRNTVKNTGALVIPQTVTCNGTQYTVNSIAKQAFYNCTGITSVTIPASITTYGDYIFTGCSGIKSVSLPDNMVTLPDGFLNQCTALASISLPQGIKALGKYSLAYCASLTSVNIPEGVTEIGDAALLGTMITDFTLPRGVTELKPYVLAITTKLKNVTLHDGLKVIGADAFQGNAAMETIQLPASLERIDAMAFASCMALTSIVIPDGVKALPSKCFYNDMALKKIQIGSGVTELGTDCFAKYSGNQLAPQLLDVYVAGNTLVSGGDTFLDEACVQATLHVQPSLVDTYKAAAGWERFGSIVAIKDGELSGITAVNSNPAANSAARYSIGGARVTDSYKGIVISGGKKYLKTK